MSNDFAFQAQETIFFYHIGGRLCQRVDLSILCAKPFEGSVEIDAGQYGRQTTAVSHSPNCHDPVAAYAPVVYPGKPVTAAVRITGGALEASGSVEIGRHRPWTIYLMNDICADFTWTMPEEDTMEASGRVIDYHMSWVEKTAGLPGGDRDRFNFNQTDELMWYVNRMPPEKARKLFERIREGHFQVSPSFNSCLTSLLHTEQLIRSLYYGRALEREHGIDISVDQQIETPTCTWGFASMLANSGVKYFIRNWLSYYSPYNDDRDDYPLFRWVGPDGKSVVVASDRAACLKRNYAQAGMFIREPYGEIVSELHGWWIPSFENNGRYPYDALPLLGSHSDLHRDTSAEIATILANVSRYNAEPWEYPKIVNATWNMYFDAIESWHERNSFEIPEIKGDWGTSWEEWPAGVAHILAGMRRNVNRFLALEAFSAAASAARPGFAASVGEELAAGLLKMEQIAEHPWNGSADWERVDSNRRRAVWNSEMERNNACLQGKVAAALFGQGKFRPGAYVAACNPLSWERDAVLRVPSGEALEALDVLTGNKLPGFYDESAGEVSFLAKGLPAMGWRLIQLRRCSAAAAAAAKDAAEIENGCYRVSVSRKNGSIESIVDKLTGKELVNRKHAYGANQFLYLSQQAEYAPDALPKALDPKKLYTVKVKTSWNVCTETPYAEKDTQRFASELSRYGADQKVTLVEYEEYTLEEITAEVSELPGLGRWMTVRGSAKNTALETVITLTDGVDGIEIENRVHKKATAEPQEVHFAFPFDVPGGRCHYDGPGAIIRPENVSAGGDHLNGSGRQMYAVQSFVDVSNETCGVTLAQVDSSLVQFGRRTTREHPMRPDVPDNTVLTLVMTNKQPEMRQNQAGCEDFTFRFAIRAHEGGYHAAESFRFGQERNVAALCLPVDKGAVVASDSPVKQYLSLDRQDVVVSAFKPAEQDDNCLVLRLRDIGGMGGAVSVDLGALPVARAFAADLLERELEEVKLQDAALRCDIAPNGYATFRLWLHCGE